MFRGSMVALVTPFKNGKVDRKGLKKLVKFHIDNNTSAIVSACSTDAANMIILFLGLTVKSMILLAI